MKNEPAASHRQSLDERFAFDPGLRQRLHEIADLRDALITSGFSLDEVENRVVEQIRLLGRQLLGTLTQSRADHATRQARCKHPEAIGDVKKK